LGWRAGRNELKIKTEKTRACNRYQKVTNRYNRNGSSPATIVTGENDFAARIYANRATGCNRHHRHPGGGAVAGSGKGKAKGRPNFLPE
jgi:hypothetical protein